MNKNALIFAIAGVTLMIAVTVAFAETRIESGEEIGSVSDLTTEKYQEIRDRVSINAAKCVELNAKPLQNNPDTQVVFIWDEKYVVVVNDRGKMVACNETAMLIPSIDGNESLPYEILFGNN
jgi:hypothetical protein